MTAPRKSRLPRIGASHFVGSVDYSPTDEVWRHIENAFNHKLEPPAQSDIVEAVKTYLRDERFERNASLIRDVEERLEGVGRAARILNQAILDDPKSDAGGPAFQAQLMIERFLADLPHVHQHSLEAIGQILRTLALAVARAKSGLGNNKGAGLAEGCAWNQLIRDLSDIAKERGLPHGVTKGVDKTVSDSPSPFVRMVESLQSTFPPEARRHYGSYQATAQAISVARRQHQ